MEVAFRRFPHLSEKSFQYLDDTNFAKCREISKIWKEYLDETKDLKIRIIRSIRRFIVENSHEIEKSWDFFFKTMDTKTIMEFGSFLKILGRKKQWTSFLKDKGLTPLHVAGFMGKLELYKEISEQIDDINPKTGEGFTPLHHAAVKGHLDLCKYIMEQIEDKNPKNVDGTTPLHMAARKGKLSNTYMPILKVIFLKIFSKVGYTF